MKYRSAYREPRVRVRKGDSAWGIAFLFYPLIVMLIVGLLNQW